MSKLKMNVDVDLVVADTLTAWLAWFKENSINNVEFNYEWHDGSYHLEQTMEQHMKCDPIDFWKQSDLYDDIDTMPDSELILKRLSKQYDIKFLTDSFPQHHQSKANFLVRRFGFHQGLVDIPASEKCYQTADVWVEDRVDTLDEITLTQPDCKVFHLINEMNKNSEVQGAIRVQSWTEIGRYLL